MAGAVAKCETHTHNPTETRENDLIEGRKGSGGGVTCELLLQ